MSVSTLYFAVRLAQVRGGIMYSRSGVEGFLDMLRFDGARVDEVVADTTDREGTWVILHGTCTRERWASFNIPVIGPADTHAAARTALRRHLGRLAAAFDQEQATP